MKFVLILGLIVFQSSCARPNPENVIAQEELLKIQEGLKRFYEDTGRYPTETEQKGGNALGNHEERSLEMG